MDGIMTKLHPVAQKPTNALAVLKPAEPKYDKQFTQGDLGRALEAREQVKP